jgi:hypothetical protein
MRTSTSVALFAAGLLIGIAAVNTLPVAHGRPSTAAPSVPERLQRLEDRAAIEELLVEYGHDLDHRDFASYSRLFAANGTWSGSIGTFTGPAAIQTAMEKAFKRNSGTAVPATFHLMTNFSIRIDGDRASASSKWTFFRMVSGKPVPSLAGSYDDTFVRERGRWKFSSRRASQAAAP